MGKRTKQTFAIGFTALLYVIYLVFVGLSAEGGNDLFPKHGHNVSESFHVEISPAPKTYGISVACYVWQIMWIIYTITTIFRDNDATKILCTKFYIFFDISVIFSIVWLFLWSRETAIGTFIVAVMSVVFLDVTLYTAFTDLEAFTSTHDEATTNKFDLWGHRSCIQNGILFLTAWSHAFAMVNTAIMFHYELGVNSQTASIVGLVLLGVCTIGWFALENFAFCEYTTHTYSAYVALIWAHSGIHVNAWGKNEPVAVLNLVLLILTCLLFVARMVLVYLKCRKKTSYENIEYNAQQQTVST